MIIILSDASLATVGSVCGSQTGELRAQKTYLGEGGGGGCKDGSDLYRPIIVKAEETGGQPSQPDNNEQSGDVKAEELSTPQVWKTRPLKEKDYSQKGEEEKAKYRKDSSTGLMMVPVTEETCEANDGFVCKVREDVQHDDDDDEKSLFRLAVGTYDQ